MSRRVQDTKPSVAVVSALLCGSRLIQIERRPNHLAFLAMKTKFEDDKSHRCNAALTISVGAALHRSTRAQQ